MAAIRSQFLSLFSGGVFPDKRWWLSCFCISHKKEEKPKRSPLAEKDKVVYTIPLTEYKEEDDQDQQQQHGMDFITFDDENPVSIQSHTDSKRKSLIGEELTAMKEDVDREVPLTKGCQMLLNDLTRNNQLKKHQDLVHESDGKLDNTATTLCEETEQADDRVSKRDRDDGDSSAVDISSVKVTVDFDEKLTAGSFQNELLTDLLMDSECKPISSGSNELVAREADFLVQSDGDLCNSNVGKDVEGDMPSDGSGLSNAAGLNKETLSGVNRMPWHPESDDDRESVMQLSLDSAPSFSSSLELQSSCNDQDSGINSSNQVDQFDTASMLLDSLNAESPLEHQGISCCNDDEESLQCCQESLTVPEDHLPDDNDRMPSFQALSSYQNFNESSRNSLVYINQEDNFVPCELPSLSESAEEIDEMKWGNGMTLLNRLQLDDHTYSIPENASQNSWTESQNSYLEELPLNFDSKDFDGEAARDFVLSEETNFGKLSQKPNLENGLKNSESAASDLPWLQMETSPPLEFLDSGDESVDVYYRYLENNDISVNSESGGAVVSIEDVTCDLLASSSCSDILQMNVGKEHLPAKEETAESNNCKVDDYSPSQLQIKLLFRADCLDALEHLAEGTAARLFSETLDELLVIEKKRRSNDFPEDKTFYDEHRATGIDRYEISAGNKMDPFLLETPDVFQEVLAQNYDQIFDNEEWLDDDFGFSLDFETKPPPPYLGTVSTQEQSSAAAFFIRDFESEDDLLQDLPSRLILLTPERIFPLIDQSTDVFWSSRRYGEPWEEVRPPETYISTAKNCSNLEDYSQRSNKLFIFDLVAEILQNIYSEELEEVTQPWQKVNKFRTKLLEDAPTTIDALKPLVQSQVMTCLEFGGGLLPEKTKRGTMSRRQGQQLLQKDKVDKVLICEMYQQETDWTDYSEDANIIKNRVANKIILSLIDDTVQALKSIRTSGVKENGGSGLRCY